MTTPRVSPEIPPLSEMTLIIAWLFDNPDWYNVVLWLAQNEPVTDALGDQQ